ncbi:MAG TPA: aldehyde dehydrogenase family protein [Polyangiales bacterium]|nr:aldehyde dehydrogenase family protein [Polyangiales bacterium]
MQPKKTNLGIVRPVRQEAPNLDYIGGAVASLRGAFESGLTRSYAWRVSQLDAMVRMLKAEDTALCEALQRDLNKPRIEAFVTELNEVIAGAHYLKQNLKKWMKPQKVSTPLVLQPGKSWIQSEPLGVALVISAWNYPVLLSLAPMLGAIAAGNAAILKPSELAPATSTLLARLCAQYLDRRALTVIEGGIPETTALLAQKFDHIFYTGNGTVGRIVMKAAAEHLTPVTLELGGKSPCIVDQHADLEVAAKRIAWAKFFNCGQTCVAPDYVLVHEQVHDRFLDLLTATLKQFWGDDPAKSPDYCRIVNGRHHWRLTDLIEGSGRVVVGGQSDAASLYIAPTVLRDVPDDAPAMSEEIFGPILPVIKVASIDEATRRINARPKPLALYLFTNNDANQQRVLNNTSSGAAVINHAVIHLGVQGLPFGGVGESGMGAYHGKHSFDTFSHKKAVLKRATVLEPDLMYPPYSDTKEKWLRRLV